MDHNDRTQSNRGDQDRPNRESNMVPAEGSRETTLTEEAVGQNDERGGGISNRPVSEEREREEHRGLRLFPRPVPPDKPAAVQAGLHDPRWRQRQGTIRWNLYDLGSS